jgi:hypothetical protein
MTDLESRRGSRLVPTINTMASIGDWSRFLGDTTFMRIKYSAEGGFAYIPALSAPVTIDTDKIAPEQAVDLEQLVKQAAFFSLPGDLSTPRGGAADYQIHTITIHDQGRSHTVRVTDFDKRPEVIVLLRALQKQATEIRRAKATEKP